MPIKGEFKCKGIPPPRPPPGICPPPVSTDSSRKQVSVKTGEKSRVTRITFPWGRGLGGGEGLWVCLRVFFFFHTQNPYRLLKARRGKNGDGERPRVAVGAGVRNQPLGSHPPGPAAPAPRFPEPGSRASPPSPLRSLFSPPSLHEVGPPAYRSLMTASFHRGGGAFVP